MSERIRDLIVAGSVREEREVTVRTIVVIQCGRCGHKFQVCTTRVYEEGVLAGHVSAPTKTSRCRRCNRVCRLDAAVEDPNVVPMRKRKRA